MVKRIEASMGKTQERGRHIEEVDDGFDASNRIKSEADSVPFCFFFPSIVSLESMFLDAAYGLHYNPIKVCGRFGERSPGRIQSS